MTKRSMCCYHSNDKAISNCKKCGKGICGKCEDDFILDDKIFCYYCHTKAMAKKIKRAVKIAKKTSKMKARKDRERKMNDSTGGQLLLFFIIYPYRYYIAVFGEMFSMLGDFFHYHYSDDESIDGTGKFLWFIWIILKVIFRVIATPVVLPFRFLFGSLRPRVRRVELDVELDELDYIVKSDTDILQNMRDYYAYLQTLAKVPDFDLSTMASQGNQLFGNTFAQSILQNGEEAALSNIRQGAVKIAANGEIIRNFEKDSTNIFAKSKAH